MGGSDISDATRRLLSKLVSHTLSLTYNWSGRGKNCFKDLTYVHKLILGKILTNHKNSSQVYDFIFVACLRKGPMTRNATEKDVETITKVWLRTAPDRNGGRGKRRQESRSEINQIFNQSDCER